MNLHINDLYFAYPDRVLFNHVNASINQRGITGISGNNGSGKSTLLKLLHGLMKPHAGFVTWQMTIQPTIAMVFQKPLMLNRSVLANIQLMLKVSNHRTDPLFYLESVNLAHLANKSALSLSGGEQQKLAFARMMALHSDIVLLDEPTANLDLDASKTIEQLIVQLSKQGKKIFLVSHDSQQIERLAQNQLRLHQGELHYSESGK
jgi:tungstate transport system ATP-binding protein